MSNKTQEAFKMAIEALEQACGLTPRDAHFCKAIQACKEAITQSQCNPHPKAPHGFSRNASHSADRYVCDCERWDAWQDGYEEGLRKGLELEQPAQEPVAWMDTTYGNLHKVNYGDSIPLYTHPAPAWQGLSNKEVMGLILISEFNASGDVGFARAIEQALKEKNNVF